jgi:hypothetical protein
MIPPATSQAVSPVLQPERRRRAMDSSVAGKSPQSFMQISGFAPVTTRIQAGRSQARAKDRTEPGIGSTSAPSSARPCANVTRTEEGPKLPAAPGDVAEDRRAAAGRWWFRDAGADSACPGSRRSPSSTSIKRLDSHGSQMMEFPQTSHVGTAARPAGRRRDDDGNARRSPQGAVPASTGVHLRGVRPGRRPGHLGGTAPVDSPVRGGAVPLVVSRNRRGDDARPGGPDRP